MHEDADADRQLGPQGPGYRLREAREARGHSVHEVAGRLRLDPAIIEALEADNFTALPAPIFAKGYLNAYCRLLGLPEGECMAEYERAVGGAKPPPLVVRRSAGDEISSSSSPVMLVTWLVALIAAAMVVLWWLAQPRVEPPPPAEEPRVSVPSPIAEPDWRAPEPAPAEEDADDVGDVGDVGDVVLVEEVVDTTQVRMEFGEESWAEVVDVDGRRLFFDLARAGSVIEVDGTAPISVFLGNAPGVRITVDGEFFNHARYVRSGNVARFVLGEAEDGQ